MPNILILSASIRIQRNSHRVALFFKNYIEDNQLAEIELADLDRHNFPLFTERITHMESPESGVAEFAQRFDSADGVIIVTPEYNGGYPASLKNVIDLLDTKWKRKPVALVTVSSGAFGGMNLITSLQFTIWKLKALTVAALFPVAKVAETYDENGVPTDKEATEKRARAFIDELLWYIEAKKRMAG